jgi:hypothetical protein
VYEIVKSAIARANDALDAEALDMAAVSHH